MSEKQISRFKIPDLKKLPEDIVEKILFVQNKSGFVPNFLFKNQKKYVFAR